VHAFFGEAKAEEAARVVSLIPQEGVTGILVRARSHLPQIVAELRRSNIPFQAVEIYYLVDRPVVQDLMALTFALLHPADRVAWLAVLRAPWCGLTLADLLALAAPHRDRPLWSLIDEATLSSDGAARIQRIRPAIDRALSQRGRRTLRELVEGAWRLLDGPAFAHSETDLDDAAAYFDLLETVDEGGDLARFDELRQKVTELFAQPDVQADGRLQVMTIHQAKGLQFDTVILPGFGAWTGHDDHPLLAFHEFGSDGLLVAPKPEAEKNRLYEYITHQETDKANNEIKRQLYVAVTRARHTLHLLGCAEVRHSDAGISAAPPRESFLKLLWDDVEAEFQRALAARARDIGPAGEQPSVERRIRRVDLKWHAPATAPAVEWEREEEPVAEERPLTFEWVGYKLRHVGTVLHQWLQRIAETGIETWDAARVRSLDGAFRAALASLGVTPVELDGAVATVSTTLRNCLTDERMRWVLSRHAEAECECALTAWIDGRYRRIRVDRTFVDEKGFRWLIDYKTSTHEGGGREGFLENEKSRYQEQLERYARIMAAMDNRPVRLALCFPLMGAWLEWDMPAVRGAA
jgi:ATP-dependent exoDNAse (exonuclease V) beta subunit